MHRAKDTQNKTTKKGFMDTTHYEIKHLAKGFASAIIAINRNSDFKPLADYRGQVVMFMNMMQMFQFYLLESGKYPSFIAILERFVKRLGLPRSEYYLCLDTLAATVITGEVVPVTISVSHDTRWKDEYDIEVDRFKAPDGGIESEFSYGVNSAFLDFYESGHIEDDLDRQIFGHYLLESLHMLHVAKVEKVIPALDGEFMRACGVIDKDQADYMAEFINIVLADFMTG